MSTGDIAVEGRGSVSGVEMAAGIGARPAKGFWADAWGQVLRRPAAMAALAWIGLIAAIAVVAPLVASGHPLLMREMDGAGGIRRIWSPLLAHLSAADLLLLVGAVVGAAWMLVPIRMARAERAWLLLLGALHAGVATMLGMVLRERVGSAGAVWAAIGLSVGVGAVAVALPLRVSPARRLTVAIVVAALCSVVMSARWRQPLERFDYREREAAGQVRCTYTILAFSPLQGDPSRYLLAPGTGLDAPEPGRGARFVLGTDPLGQDVLSQLLHACRLSISIGLVSTGIAVSIGVTLGALAGYFGGAVDLIVQRLIEVFMAIPVLFLLIVAAGVLPPELRSTYVMMAVIGLVTWTGAARFTRAEFYKLRGQDFVQAARAVGLPLRSILFRHMLPNGVTPVLVDASFSIAAAILAEATLSFLGLGPIDQASWGKLLSSATGTTGQFVWWLAVFPGLAIFLTVLSYNIIGEALRDAIDPKLKQARV